MRLVSVTTGKSRKISGTAWVKAEATIEFDENDNEEDQLKGIRNLLEEIEQLLIDQEVSENERTQRLKNQLKEFQDRQRPQPESAPDNDVHP